MLGVQPSSELLVAEPPQVPGNRPDVAFDSILLAGVQALPQLVAPRGKFGICRQNFAGIEGNSRSKEIPKNGIETVLG